MRGKKLILLLTLIALLLLAALLNIEVTTKQAKDLKVSRLELPLYLKVVNFYSRHFNYKWLVKRITGHLKTKEEKIFRIFQWTHRTIVPQPDELPIMDDHVWNVFIRGYGVSDNFNDLFSTLCNYVGTDAFFLKFFNTEHNQFLNLSFVKTFRGWVVFDPYNGVYFKNSMGQWATIPEIKKQDWTTVHTGKISLPDSYYKPYLKKIPDITKIGLGRASTQSPINRLRYQLKTWLRGERHLLE